MKEIHFSFCVFHSSLVYHTTEVNLEPWLEFLCQMNLFIREELNPKYNQTSLTFAKNQDIDINCIHTAEDLFKKMRNDSSLQDEMKVLHHEIPIFKGPIKYATWLHVKTNVEKRSKSKLFKCHLVLSNISVNARG